MYVDSFSIQNYTDAVHVLLRELYKPLANSFRSATNEKKTQKYPNEPVHMGVTGQMLSRIGERRRQLWVMDIYHHMRKTHMIEQDEKKHQSRPPTYDAVRFRI